jgi:coenzyme F420-dependent glucose-6-phosphate dehydrogenase
MIAAESNPACSARQENSSSLEGANCLADANRLWREERVTFEGQYYRTENATIYDRPENPVPIYVAAAGPTAATLAGEVADGFCTSSKPAELYRETLLPNVAAGLP